MATLRGHESSVKSISLHSSGRFALAVSSRDSVMWDLDSFARCRTLNGGQEVGVQEVRGNGPASVSFRNFPGGGGATTAILILKGEHKIKETNVLLPPPSNKILMFNYCLLWFSMCYVSRVSV